MNVIVGIAIFAGGYAASIFTWNWVHTQWLGAAAKADKLREQARALEASVRAKL